jgi:uncharacterized protein
MTCEEALRTLQAHQNEWKSFGADSLAIFGSVARNEAGPESDVDILVEFARPVGLLEFVRLQRYLETLLGNKVDLVTADALKPALRERILGELIHAA